MARISGRSTRLAALVIVLAAFILLAAAAFGASGDYGVNTGASAASSGCGGSGPPCSITVNGHPASYQSTNDNGSVIYKFDNYDCTAIASTFGVILGNGSECSSVASTATPQPSASPEP